MSYSFKANNDQVKEIIRYYQGFRVDNDNSFAIFRAKLSDCTITVYTTNTVLFQGASAKHNYLIWAKKYGYDTSFIAPEDKKEYANLSAIGTDEVGTGDFYGPVIVAATFVAKDKIAVLQQLGVKDSKLLTDETIIKLSKKITKIVPYCILVLPNENYNRFYQNNQGNLNYIKAMLHNKVILKLQRKLEGKPYDVIIIDEFTPKEKYLEYLNKQKQVEKDIEMVQRAESKHIAVACSSILARAAFISELEKLSKKVNRELLKGASNMVDQQAAEIIKDYGKEIFKSIAKLNFSNFKRALELSKKIK